ncbi:hypothetical protein [Glycomyces xiaoerkulensis]|uniref:hypothetical protein n=1 Tax=Glycomyces xiaoerkulensis TaxID=2038139 RepID=UPI000C2611F8|nr:hypothetical protein [Glycomyces xiaoerkulensis]
MTTIVASVEVEATASARRKLTFSVEFNNTTAVVRYRSTFLVNEVDVVLTTSHNGGRICQVSWNQHWWRYLAPSIRSKLLGQVQQLLKTQHRKPQLDRRPCCEQRRAWFPRRCSILLAGIRCCGGAVASQEKARRVSGLAGGPVVVAGTAGHFIFPPSCPPEAMSLTELLKNVIDQTVQIFRDSSGLLEMRDFWWVALALAVLALYYLIHSLIYPWRRCLRCNGTGKKHAGVWPRRVWRICRCCAGSSRACARFGFDRV